jgi:hypothetical protein
MRGSKQPAGRLRAEPGLGPGDLRAIEELAVVCVPVDGGRPKLEWGILQSRPPEQVNDFLWTGTNGLVGFLGLYGFRPEQVELCGMVHPSARRQGVFSHDCSKQRRPSLPAGVCPRSSWSWTAFMRPVLPRRLRRGHDRALRAPHDAAARACPHGCRSPRHRPRGRAGRRALCRLVPGRGVRSVQRASRGRRARSPCREVPRNACRRLCERAGRNDSHGPEGRQR